MDHLEAIQLSAVEKYLLNELAPEMRDAFEEHYFDCQDCTTDLHATTAFMDAARQELRTHPVHAPAKLTAMPAIRPYASPLPVDKKKGSLLYVLFQRPAIVVSALAASLLVIAYQNTLVLPQLHNQVASIDKPEILPTLSLAGSNSRGGTLPGLTVQAEKPFLLSADIPADDRFSSYTCELQSPSGASLWRVPVTAEAAKDMVTIHAPAMHEVSGRYTLVVRGNQGAVSSGNLNEGGIELARYGFDLSVQR